MGPIGFWEIVAIAVVALVVLGPRRLPDTARRLGKAVRQFKDHSESVKSELRDAINPDDLKDIVTMQRDLKDAVSFRGIVDAAGFEDLTAIPETVSDLTPDSEPSSSDMAQPAEVTEDSDSAASSVGGNGAAPTRRFKTDTDTDVDVEGEAGSPVPESGPEPAPAEVAAKAPEPDGPVTRRFPGAGAEAK